MLSKVWSWYNKINFEQTGMEYLSKWSDWEAIVQNAVLKICLAKGLQCYFISIQKGYGTFLKFTSGIYSD